MSLLYYKYKSTGNKLHALGISKHAMSLYSDCQDVAHLLLEIGIPRETVYDEGEHACNALGTRLKQMASTTVE